MKKFLLAIVLLISVSSFAQKSKDTEPPVILSMSINNGHSIAYGYEYGVPVQACVSDDVNIFMVIFQIDPIGQTHLAPNKANKEYWGAVDFYRQGCYYFIADEVGQLAPGQHIFRITVFDRARNETSEEVSFFITP